MWRKFMKNVCVAGKFDVKRLADVSSKEPWATVVSRHGALPQLGRVYVLWGWSTSQDSLCKIYGNIQIICFWGKVGI